MIKIGSDFSGVGAFNQALIRLGIEHEEVFACDMDKYARQTFILNYGEPAYYPKDVYEREIPEESLDIYMTSPPCQAFSLAGKRKGEDDRRGILFYNSHEFIVKNKPRYFIIENVKGLLSDDSGKTFQRWIDYLAGKSVNGNYVIFPHEEATPYHVYYQVLNAKHYGVPQNRERIFIIGIRDDADNDFSFPKPFPLEKRLKDVLESQVDEKYFLSDNKLESISNWKSFKNPLDCNLYDENSDIISCSTARGDGNEHSGMKLIKIGNINPSGNGMNGNVFLENGISLTITTNKGEGIKIEEIRGCNLQNPKTIQSGLETEQMIEINENGTSNALTTVQKDNVVIIPTNNSKGFDLAEEEEDSINFSNPNSETRRGRVGKKVSQTLDTACNQGIATRQLTKQETENWIQGGLQANQPKQTNGISPCLTSAMGMGVGQTPIHNYNQRIRRLTPIECFKLMDFNFGIPGVEDFKWDVSDSQAYKQAGNSVVVNVLCEIIKKLKL